MVGSYSGLGGDSGASRTHNACYIDQAFTVVGNSHSFIHHSFSIFKESSLPHEEQDSETPFDKRLVFR